MAHGRCSDSVVSSTHQGPRLICKRKSSNYYIITDNMKKRPRTKVKSVPYLRTMIASIL